VLFDKRLGRNNRDKLKMNKNITWEGYDCTNEREEFFEVLIENDSFVSETLFNVLLQTRKDMKTKNIEQLPEFGIKYTSSEGETYIIRERCIHKFYNKFPRRYSINGNNELVKVPFDAVNFLFFKTNKKEES